MDWGVLKMWIWFNEILSRFNLVFLATNRMLKNELSDQHLAR